MERYLTLIAMEILTFFLAGLQWIAGIGLVNKDQAIRF
jgi:hypothetical protein